MSHPRFPRTVALVVAATLALAACSSGSSGSPEKPKAGPVVVDGVVNLPAVQQRLDAVMKLSSDAQRRELAALDNTFERQLWSESGLEAALGGKPAADAAFDAHGEALTEKARTAGQRPVTFKPAAYVVKSGSPNIGGGLFGGYMAVALLSSSFVSGTNDVKDGEHGSKQVSEDIRVEASRENVSLTMDTTQASDGVTSRMRAQFAVAPCPDAQGQFEATAKVDVSATKTGGTTGQKGTLDVTVKGQVNDDAELESSDSDWRMQWADFANSKGGFVDLSGGFTATKAKNVQVNRAGGKATQDLVNSAAILAPLYALMLSHDLTKAAEQGWKSGRCVRLEATASMGPKGLKPSASPTIKANSRSRVDGTPAGGTVTAKLSAGGAGVSPEGSKVKADATFAYTAPGEKDKSGTVSLEARSKRGVAKSSIDFDTKQGGYVASGGTKVKVSGKVSSLTEPFTVHGTGRGFTVDYSYTPTSASGGTVTYSGAGGGVSMQGKGTYTISGDDPVRTLKQTTTGCTSPVGGCMTQTNIYRLTRDGS